MRIRVSIRDKVGKDFRVEEKIRVERLEQTDLERLAKETEKIIRDTITRKITRAGSTGNLAHGFYAHSFTFGSRNGWAVGDINELDKILPYWNHQDKGSEAIGANWRHVLPKGKFINDRWVESEDGYYFVPSKPIPAKNYIAETIQQIESLLPSILK